MAYHNFSKGNQKELKVLNKKQFYVFRKSNCPFPLLHFKINKGNLLVFKVCEWGRKNCYSLSTYLCFTHLFPKSPLAANRVHFPVDHLQLDCRV